MHAFSLQPAKDFFTQRSADAQVVGSLSIIALVIVLLFVFNRTIARIAPKLLIRTDNITTTENVLKIRRAETITGLVITVVRVIIIIVGILAIWRVTNGGSTSLALIGVGTIIAILASATVVPLLRDVTYGFIMIVEHWYGIGDHIVVEPFAGSGGVVEKMTLRSTKLRSVNGEAIWWHHSYMQGARVTSAASHFLVVETFVNDPERGRQVIEDAIDIIPSGPTTVPQPLAISEVKKIKDNIWRITAVCEITPFREWMIEDFAIKVIHKTDELSNKETVLVHGPIAYYADSTADKRYRRSATVRKRLRASSNSK